MKIGDKVKITDGSYAMRIDKHDRHDGIGLCRDQFEILYFDHEGYFKNERTDVHDVVIQNQANGRIYLHSKALIRVVAPPVKEVTMSQIESHYGCKVKIIK